MASDAQHQEVKHHPEPGKHPEKEHNALILHANGAPKAKSEAKGKTAEVKHEKADKGHDTSLKHPHLEHKEAPKAAHVAAKHPGKDSSHQSVESASPKLVHHDAHTKPLEKPIAHDAHKNSKVAEKHGAARPKEEHHLPPLAIDKGHHPIAKTHSDAQATEALRKELQKKFAAEGESITIEGKVHTAQKSAAPEVHAAPHPQVAAKPQQHADNSSLHAFASYIESTAAFKAVENMTSWASHPTAAAAAQTKTESPAPRPMSHAEKELLALQRGDCGGARTPIIENWITRNEVAKHTYTAYTPNDNNTGIAVGELQWNQKRGSLPDLLRAWHHEDAAKFDQIFGKYSKDLLSNQYVKKADFNGIPELLNGMHTALADKDFQGVQDSLRTKQIYHYCEVAHSFGFNSIRGEGYVADAANQKGLHVVEEILAGIDDLKYSQSKRIDMFRERTDIDRQNGKARNERVSQGSKAVYTVVENLKKQVQLADNENPGK